MIDLSTPKGRIVEAAMRLAATKPWREVTMAEIAQGARDSEAAAIAGLYAFLICLPTDCGICTTS